MLVQACCTEFRHLLPSSLSCLDNYLTNFTYSTIIFRFRNTRMTALTTMNTLYECLFSILVSSRNSDCCCEGLAEASSPTNNSSELGQLNF